MTVEHARESFVRHMLRLKDSVLQRQSISLYLCDTDLQDVAMFHLSQAGGIIERYPEIVESLALADEVAEWLIEVHRMTVEETDDIDHVAIWNAMVPIVPLLC